MQPDQGTLAVGLRPEPSAATQRRWVALFATTRAVATLVAVLLLAVQAVGREEFVLIAVGVGYGAGSITVAWLSDRAARSPIFWLLDAAVTLSLVYASGDWRSPFYLFAVTSLVLPITTLRFWAGLVYGSVFTGAYLAIAFATGLGFPRLATTVRLETLATRLLVPMLVVLALAYAARLLDHLERERKRSEELAVETERRRIAWELHDSSKQRVHAAHLVLSQLPDRLSGDDADAVRQALAELRGATTDMEASVRELRAPIRPERLEVQLRQRAAELSRATNARIVVKGQAPELPARLATHIYRIAAEALTNAVRHAQASTIEIALAAEREALEVTVTDDGRGIDPRDDDTSGISSMEARTAAVRGELAIGRAENGRGTRVRLTVPLDRSMAEIS